MKNSVQRFPRNESPSFLFNLIAHTFFSFVEFSLWNVCWTHQRKKSPAGHSRSTSTGREGILHSVRIVVKSGNNSLYNKWHWPLSMKVRNLINPVQLRTQCLHQWLSHFKLNWHHLLSLLHIYLGRGMENLIWKRTAKAFREVTKIDAISFIMQQTCKIVFCHLVIFWWNCWALNILRTRKLHGGKPSRTK